MTLISILIAIIPTIIILTIVYRTDKEKEPKKLLISLFGIGIISSFLTIIISYCFEILFPSIKPSDNFLILLTYCFIKVSLIEEFCKWLFCYSIGWNNKEFNHKYDAIVYSVFVSVGFATFENILYSVHYGVHIALIRCFISVPSHAFFAVFMGYFISKSKFSTNSKISIKYMVLSLIIPILLHGLYNLLIYIGTGMLIPFLLFVTFLYVESFIMIKKVSK